MRSLEALLLFANLPTLLVVLTARSCGQPWFRLAASIALLVAVAQAWVEGPRWQVVPAYALTAALFVAAMLQQAETAGEPAWRLRLRQLAAAIGMAWLAASVLLPVTARAYRVTTPTETNARPTLTTQWGEGRRCAPPRPARFQREHALLRPCSRDATPPRWAPVSRWFL
jgi:hypothetical protein